MARLDTAEYLAARERLTRKLNSLDRGIRSAAHRHDDTAAGALSDAYLFFAAERAALDKAQRRSAR